MTAGRAGERCFPARSPFPATVKTVVRLATAFSIPPSTADVSARRLSLAVVACVLVLAGCSAAPAPKVTETVTVTPSGPGSPSTSDTRFSNGASVSPSASSSSPRVATLGGVCEDLLPSSTVNTVIGFPLAGKTSFVVGRPEPSIERLVYLNCRYGIAAPAKGKPAVPKVEVGMSLYASDLRAASRVEGTVSDFVGLGATATKTTVDGKPATILTGYKDPTLVIAVGPRTVAVSIVAKVVGSDLKKDLVGIAKAALDATAHFQK